MVRKFSSNLIRILFVAGFIFVGSPPVTGYQTTAPNDLALTQEATAAKTIDFETSIQPIFNQHCVQCHGPEKTESRFRVDSRSSFLDGGDYGEPVVLPGQPHQSRLIAILEKSDPDLQMPPGDARVSEADLKKIRRWILQGAKMPQTAGPTQPNPGARTRKQAAQKHWAFQPLRKLPVSVDSKSNPIDTFVLRKLEESDLKMSVTASRFERIRRLYLVMLGVPPTPGEVRSFQQDASPRAWENLVDRVLLDSRYGERWGQHWLDLVRFGETDGFETNRERPNAWRYRDWVINAFNDDKPYDQFVREQIAGDQLGEPLGTGFLVAGPHDIVKSPDIKLTLTQRQDELADMVHTTATAFLGLTIGCARCHDHKFDPISQTDYYAIQSIFSGVRHGEREIPRSQRTRQRVAELSAQSRTLLKKLAPVMKTDWPSVWIDDSNGTNEAGFGFEAISPIAGTGNNPNSPDNVNLQTPLAKGFRDHPHNLSLGQYTWWKNRPSNVVAAYRPGLSGRYRVSISWGHGFSTHTQAAEYILDQDGSPATQHDQRVIATINQQRPAFEQERSQFSALPEQPLWSGFYTAGEFDLQSSSAVLIRCGKTGTAITADMIHFQRIEQSKRQTPFDLQSQPVNARQNIESFRPILAEKLRFEITDTNQAEPCLDELEVYSITGRNIALASLGTRVTSSGNYANNPKHQLKHVNDGKHGNDFSWISSTAKSGWVELEFPGPVEINRIVWGRDRTGTFSDRLATEYKISVFSKGSWRRIGDSTPRLKTNFSTPQPLQFHSSLPAETEATKTRWLTLVNERNAIQKNPRAFVGLFDSSPPRTHRLHRGDPLSKREEVTPNTVAVLGKLELDENSTDGDRRVAFARWITTPQNPLTSRVIANRVWQFHFGHGLAITPSDFGTNGVGPTHPHLLDWLAGYLVQQDWSLKKLHRQILTSRTWQQSSRPNLQGLQQDANTRLFWRFPPRRLEAEPIRDSILAVSGNLDSTQGGPGFSGFEVQKENVRHYFPIKTFGPQHWRRMVYMTKIRQEREATFGVFDCPDGGQVTPKRSRSTTPLQSLNLFNSPFIEQQSEIFSQRLLESDPVTSQGKVSPVEAIIKAYQLCYSRRPDPSERRSAEEFVKQNGLTQFCRALFNSNEFLFIP